MDQLYWDTFGHHEHDEHDVHDDDNNDDDVLLLYQALQKQFIRQCPCPCRRFQQVQNSNSVSHYHYYYYCVRCKVSSHHPLFARRQLDEIVSSSHQASSARSLSDHHHLALALALAVEASAALSSSEEDLVGDGFLLLDDLLRWNDEKSDYDYYSDESEDDDDDDDDDERTRLLEEIPVPIPDRPPPPRWRDDAYGAEQQQQSDYYYSSLMNNTTDETSDYHAEKEKLNNHWEQRAESDISSASSPAEFNNSPALQLVIWETFMSSSSHRQQIPCTPRNTATNHLRRAAQITFGRSYGKGTAHAVGLFANCDDPSVWLRLGCWIRRQRETWLHTSRIGVKYLFSFGPPRIMIKRNSD